VIPYERKMPYWKPRVVDDTTIAARAECPDLKIFGCRPAAGTRPTSPPDGRRSIIRATLA
jgi:hypothetical protein